MSDPQHPGLEALRARLAEEESAYAEMLECKLTPLTGVEEVLCKPFRAGSLREAIAKFLPARQASP